MVLCVSLAGGASPPRGRDSPEPPERLAAVTAAGRTEDRTAIPHLIESLYHDDPVVRLAAIRTLEQLTGQTLGYDYAGPEWERRERAAAWVEWYRRQSPDNRNTPASPDAHPAAGAGPIQ